MKLSVKQLRSQVLAEYDADRTEEEKTFDAKLKEAHDCLVETMVTSVAASVSEALEDNPGTVDTIVMNPQKGARLMGHNFHYVFYGGRRRRHHFARILKTPLQEVQERLAPFGVTEIVDVTDPDKNCALMLKVSFPLDGSL